MRRAILLALAATAWADGKFVSTRVPVVEIPDQQAIVVWKDGRERLVIDTAHSGEGDLAWIVPLPAPPRIEPVSPAVFRTLEVVTMPDLVAEAEPWWLPGLWFLAAITVIWATRSRWAGVAAGLSILAGLYTILSILMPRSSGGEVTVLDRGRAGSYDTATVESVDAGALLSWLERNGFQAPPEIRSGIEEYVRDGWVFAVARLKSGGRGGRAHPLSFEFDARGPVYPMRLTGTQDRPISLRLFVLSDRRASCDPLSVESCYRTRGPGPPYGDDEVRQIGQPELLRIAAGATVLTTLVGDLGASRGDLRLEFEDYAPRTPVVYSEDASRAGATGTAVWVALALLLPCYLLVWTIRERRKGWRHVLRSPVTLDRRGRIITWCVAVCLGLTAGVVDFATMETVETRGGGAGFIEFHMSHRSAERLVAAAATDDIEKARPVAAAVWVGRTNPYDGREVREEASPGNYGLEMRDGKIVYVRYDARGTPVDDG